MAKLTDSAVDRRLEGGGVLNARLARGERGSIQSIDRALTLLEALGELGTATLKDLAGHAGLNSSTCHHLLSTLGRWGYVAKTNGRSYALGARVLHLAQAFLRQVDLPQRAQPVLDKIGEETGETVHLAVMQADAVVTLLKRESRHALRVDTGAPGASEAPHAAATGKAMLAWLPEDEIRRILAVHGMPRYTANTIDDVEEFIEHLRQVRRNGFSVDREEFQPGVICVGAAIRNHSGTVVGALSVSAPATRATEPYLLRMRESVIAGARALSAEFGDPGPETPRDKIGSNVN